MIELVKQTPITLFARKHRILIVYFVAFVAMTSIVFADFIFGNDYFVFRDIGGDTSDQYFAYYTHLINSINDDSLSLWTFKWGLGTDLLNSQSWIMDPFAWFVVAFGVCFGISAAFKSMVFAHVVKIALAVVLFDRYLNFFGVSGSTRTVFSLLYGFNGFMMLWGQHYFFGTAVVYLTLLLLVFEKQLLDPSIKNAAYIALSVFCVAVFSVYICLICMVFLVFYSIFRILFVLPSLKIRFFVNKALQLVVPTFLGLSLSAIVLMPAIVSLLNESGRLSYSESTMERSLKALASIRVGWEWLELSRFLSNNLVIDSVDYTSTMLDSGGATNYYEVPQMMVTYLFFLIIPYFFMSLFRNGITGRRRIVVVCATALIVFYFISDFPTFVLYAFTQVSFRTTFTLIPVLALACALGFDDFISGNKSFSALLIGFAVSSIMLGLSLAYSAARHSFISVVVASILFCSLLASFYLMLYMMRTSNETVRRCCIYGVIILMLGGSALDGYVTNCERSTWNSSDVVISELSDGTGTAEAVALIKQNDSELFRIEKTYYELSPFSDSLYQGYNGISSYNSTQIPGVREFYSNIWPEISLPKGRNDKYQQYWTHPDDAEKATLLGVKYIVSDHELDYAWVELYAKTESRWVYKNVNAHSIGTKLYRSATLEEYSKTAGDGAALLDDYILFDDVSSGLGSGAFNPNQDERSELRFDNDVQFYFDGRDCVSCVCYMDKAGYLLIAIPAKSGWRAVVDGDESTLQVGDCGFLALALEKGMHTIELSYSIPGMLEGATISCFALLLCVVILGVAMFKRCGLRK